MNDVTQDYAEKAGLEILDFTIDYTDDLAESDPADTINSSSWSEVGDLTITSNSYLDQKATVWVSGGGRVGNVNRLTNTVTTTGGRQFVRTLLVKMVTKLAQAEDEDLITYETPSIP